MRESRRVERDIAQLLTCEFLSDHEQLMALGRFRMECLVDGEMLVLQGEDLIAMDVREGYINRDQQPYISSPSPPLSQSPKSRAVRRKTKNLTIY